MSALPQSPSIHGLPPLERGGVEARQGFEFQDHVAASFLVELLENPALLEVWCETHDDITLLRLQCGQQEVEFVQVKDLSLNQLWSVAKLTERDRKDKHAVSGTSILERSLENDRCCEPCRFRLVTSLPPNAELAFLKLNFDAPDRLAEKTNIASVADDLDRRMNYYRNKNGHGADYWLKNTLWDVHQSVETLTSLNKLRLHEVVAKNGVILFPDQLDELYSVILTLARDAALADWGASPAKKKICRTNLLAWLTSYLEARRQPPPVAGTNLEGKLNRAGLQPGDIAACMDSRHRYLAERYSPKYLTFSDLTYLEGEVGAVLHGLRARLDAGEIPDDGIGFHAACLKAVEKLRETGLGSQTPLSLVYGCMYNIADRCVHRFRRASA